MATVDSATNDSMLLPAAYAQDQTPGQKTRKTPAMRESVYKKLSEAQEASEAGRESEALAILEDLKRDKNLNSYELAQLYSSVETDITSRKCWLQSPYLFTISVIYTER